MAVYTQDPPVPGVWLLSLLGLEATLQDPSSQPSVVSGWLCDHSYTRMSQATSALFSPRVSVPFASLHACLIVGTCWKVAPSRGHQDNFYSGHSFPRGRAANERSRWKWEHLVPGAAGSAAALVPLGVGTGLLSRLCFTPECARFLDLTASHLVEYTVPAPAHGLACCLPASQEEPGEGLGSISPVEMNWDHNSLPRRTLQNGLAKEIFL